MRINEPQTILWRTKQAFMRHKTDCGYSASHKLNKQESATWAILGGVPGSMGRGSGMRNYKGCGFPAVLICPDPWKIFLADVGRDFENRVPVFRNDHRCSPSASTEQGMRFPLRPLFSPTS